jgi:hypothetical protein
MLVKVVVICNLIIVGFNIYLIVQICRLKKCFANTADFLTDLDENFAIILKESPSLIIDTAWEIYQLRNKYKLLQKRNQQIRKILFLIQISYQIWQRKFT